MAANSLVTLGQCAQHLRDYPAARTQAEHVLCLARTVDNRRGTGLALELLGAAALAEGSYEEASAHCAESLAIWQQAVGHPSQFGSELAGLSLAARGTGHHDGAWEHILSQHAWAQESPMLMPAPFGLA